MRVEGDARSETRALEAGVENGAVPGDVEVLRTAPQKSGSIRVVIRAEPGADARNQAGMSAEPIAAAHLERLDRRPQRDAQV